MAGKTSLAQVSHYEAKKKLRTVFRISLWWMFDYVNKNKWKFTEGFKSLTNMEWDEFIQLCRS